jgi:hypothetical protein
MEKELTLFDIRLKFVLNEFSKEMRLIKSYYKKAKFSCFDSDIFTYGLKQDNSYHEISFICDDTLLAKMTIKELTELKRISFFQHRIFDEKMNLIHNFGTSTTSV